MFRSRLDPDGDSGIAYGWFMLLVFLIVGAVSWMCLAYLFNGIIAPANTDIVSGVMSMQTKNTMGFSRDLAMYLPVFMLVGSFIWAMLRGIGGSGATYQAFYTGYVIFVLCCATAFMMAFLGGTLIDRLYTSLDGMNYINNATTMTPQWAKVQDDTMWNFVNLYYFLCDLCAVLGGIVYFQSIVRNTSGNRFVR
jgi:hypothetical protein